MRNFEEIFSNSGLDVTNYSNFLINLSETVSDASYSTNVSPKVIDVGTFQYNSTAVDARANLIDTHDWTITDGGLEASN